MRMLWKAFAVTLALACGSTMAQDKVAAAKKEGKEARFGPSNGADGVPDVDFGDSLKIKTPWQGGDGTAWNEPKREKKAAK